MKNQTTRRDFLQAGLALPLRALRSRANVVLFLTDDHGAWALGGRAGGSGVIRTPHIDRLASSGVCFRNAFAATPVCSPSRMTLLTGKLPSAHGVQDWLVPEDCTGPGSRLWLEGHRTFTEVLASRGYELAFCGKWHMGGDDHPQAGFRYWVSTIGSRYRDPEMSVNGQRARQTGFVTDLTTDAALEFLNRKHRNPFFLLISLNAPHTPYDYQPEADRAVYARETFETFPWLQATPSPRQNPQLRQHFGRLESLRAYASLIHGIDRNVGRVLDTLERLRLRTETTVIFTSDQGWNAGQDGVWGKGNGTVPFNLLDGSTRVPLIWSHPGRIAADTVREEFVSHYDFFPTVLDWLRVAPPAPHRERVGRSYARALAGKPLKSWPDRVYFEYAYTRGVRTRLWKYVERVEAWPSELFNEMLANGETIDCSHQPQYRRWREELASDLKAFFERSGAPPLSDWRRTTQQRLPEYPLPEVSGA
jgi:arylsulfatase A-like enzyme